MPSGYPLGENYHGTLGGYTNHDCRCGQCRAANAAYMRELRKRYRDNPTPDDAHGKPNTYRNYGCRCEACTTAQRVTRKRVRERRAATK